MVKGMKWKDYRLGSSVETDFEVLENTGKMPVVRREDRFAPKHGRAARAARATKTAWVRYTE